MRVGQNPAKSIDRVPQPEKVTVALATHIPSTNEGLAGSLDVLKACLGSIWENTGLHYDLLVFDNASCPQVRSFLLAAHNQGRIQYLALSDHHVGKSGAWDYIVQGAPGEVIAFSHGALYFNPGWLAQALHLLESSPEAACVTGPAAPSCEDLDPIVGYKSALQNVNPYSRPEGDIPDEPVSALERRLNERGYRMLCAGQPFARHLGNRLEDGTLRPQKVSRASPGLKKRFVHARPVRWALLRLYDQIFRLYFEGE